MGGMGLQVRVIKDGLFIGDTFAHCDIRLEEQEEKPDDTRKKRSRQNRNLRHQNLTRIGIREIRHEDGHGEANTTEQRRAEDVRPVHVIRKRRDLELHDEEAEEEDADGLAQE